MIIAYKTLAARLQAAQARRIRCAFCSTTHTVLAVRAQEYQVVGVPLLSSDAGMRRDAYLGRSGGRAGPRGGGGWGWGGVPSAGSSSPG